MNPSNFYDHPTSGHATTAPTTVDRVEHNDLAATLFPQQMKEDLDRQGQQIARQRAQQAPAKEAPALSEEQKAEKLFNSGQPELYHSDAMRGIEQAAMEEFLASPEEATEAATHWGSVFQEAGLTGTESAQIADIGISAFKAPPTPEIVETWVEQSQQALVQDYGPKGARAALDDARRFVELHASPDLKEVLETTGLGNHPQVVRIIAAKARAARNAGKLR